ncbi:YceI family protein [Colwellia sp. BRX10-3]|uniref:YceI family protein n=1 Tax=Colwellia sp. BRX10-3 TaxID=2759844 RepID=UPI0015F41943|nr:YceI family protein [Colwellia sp. BRX10-3]MBA6392259.1 YceI family protein [Colwellia sp. BRX10-3]
MHKKALILISLLLVTTVSVPALAAWKLDNSNSQLSFISVKKATIAENHSFAKLAGNINEQAQVNISVDLASVNTNIAIRDERMKKFVFESETYSTANFTAALDKALLKTLEIGEDKKMSISGAVDFHGQQQAVIIDVIVVKLSANKILVNTIKPFFIQADAFGVVAGINKLKELASLPSIDYVVPVSFSVTFTR